MGIALMKSSPIGVGYRIPALYVPQCSMNILSNAQLHKIELKVSHDLKDARLMFPDHTKVLMSQRCNISVVNLQRPAPFIGNMLFDIDVPNHWLTKTMHASV